MKIEFNVDGATVRAVCALALLMSCTTLVNAWVYPALYAALPAAREIWSGCSVAAILLVALAAHRRPALLTRRPLTLVSAAATLTGPLLACAGIRASSAALVGAGSAVAGLGDAWFAAVVGVALIELRPARCAVCIPAALVLNGLAALAILACGAGPGPEASCCLYAAANIATYVLVRPLVGPTLDRLCSPAALAPSDLAPTNPFAFLPITHPLLVCILSFAAAYGLALALQTTPDAGLTLLQALPAVVGLALAACARSRQRFRRRGAATTATRTDTAHHAYPIDRLFRSAAFLLLAGVLLFPFALGIPAGASTALAAASPACLHVAYGCFALLSWYLVAALGARNPAGALVFSATVTGLSWLGITLGADCGIVVAGALAPHASATPLACALAGLLIVLYYFIVLRTFSLEESVLAVESAAVDLPVRTPHAAGFSRTAEAPAPAGNTSPTVPGLDETAFARHCADLARSFALTPRESEIFELLARGRSAPVIQERLTLSHNTIKTHVRHIYEKTGIHSQQGIIDLVDRTLPR